MRSRSGSVRGRGSDTGALCGSRQSQERDLRARGETHDGKPLQQTVEGLGRALANGQPPGPAAQGLRLNARAAPDVTVSHVALLAAVQAQPAPAVTSTLPLAAAAAID